MTSLDGLAHTCHARPIDSAVMAGTLHSAMHMKVPVPSVPRLCLTVALLNVLFQALLERAQGAPVPVNGTMVYTQNFDSLGTASRPWANDSTIPGWYAQINNGSTATGSAQASDGTAANLSGLLNLGAAGSPDRALGSKATSTGGFANISYGVQFQNTSASQIRVLRVTYTGELWRTNSTTEGQEETLVPCYAVSSTKITDIRSGASADFASAGSGFTGLGVGSAWTSTNNLPPASHHNGNAPENRTTVSYFSSAPIVNPGQYVVIKWTDANEGGSDGYLGLDDVTIEFETLSGRPGSVDLSFNPILASTAANSYTDVNTLALQADGKILVGGYFHSVDGALRSHMARLNPDGTPDTDFDPAAGSNVRHFAIYGDGRILFGGDFTTVGAAETLRLARVDSQGIFDPSYLPSADDRVYTSRILPDRKLLVSGSFYSVNGIVHRGIARLDADGILAPSFTATAEGTVSNVLVQPDGKILLGGSFTKVSGVAHRLLARLSADGSLDKTFNPVFAGTGVDGLSLQPDGKLIVCGSFGMFGAIIGGVERRNLLRLHPDGTLDTGFVPVLFDGGSIGGAILQTDGRMIVSGVLGSAGGIPRGHIARINPDGSLDKAFNPIADLYVTSVALQADGKIVVGGPFDSIGGLPRKSLARLHNDPATQSLSVPDPSRILWFRGGASPETCEVTFEYSAEESGPWTRLGAGMRIEDGWELKDLNLPTTGYIRARARIYSGAGHRSSGWVETITGLSRSPLQLWRLEHFGTFENAAASADNADPDHDGLENLIEFGFGTDPADTTSLAILPAWQHDHDGYVLDFTSPPGVSGLTYTAEFSTSLDPAGWNAISNSSTVPHYTFNMPSSSAGRLYLRLRVAVP